MKITFSLHGTAHSLDVERAPEGFEIQIDGVPARVHAVALDPPRLAFSYNGRIVTAWVASDGKRRWIHVDGATYALERGAAAAPRAASPGEHEGAGAGLVTAPMPGQVRGVMVQPGDWVEEGQALLLLEAMKMELRLSAPCAGQVRALYVQTGTTVEREQVLAEIDTDAQSESQEPVWQAST